MFGIGVDERTFHMFGIEASPLVTPDNEPNDVLASTISPKTLYAGPKLPNRKFITSLGDL